MIDAGSPTLSEDSEMSHSGHDAVDFAVSAETPGMSWLSNSFCPLPTFHLVRVLKAAPPQNIKAMFTYVKACQTRVDFLARPSPEVRLDE